MSIDSKLILTGSIFIITILSGIILSRLGKPYNSLMFNIHKLIALFVLVYTLILTISIFKGAETNKIMIIVLPAIILFSLGAFITGAVMSINQEGKSIVLNIHKVLSIIILLGACITIILSVFF